MLVSGEAMRLYAAKDAILTSDFTNMLKAVYKENDMASYMGGALAAWIPKTAKGRKMTRKQLIKYRKDQKLAEVQALRDRITQLEAQVQAERANARACEEAHRKTYAGAIQDLMHSLYNA